MGSVNIARKGLLHAAASVPHAQKGKAKKWVRVLLRARNVWRADDCVTSRKVETV